MEVKWELVQKILLKELMEGMEVAKQLKQHLNEAPSMEKPELLTQKILNSYEKALLVLNFKASSPQTVVLTESTDSINGSPASDGVEGAAKEKEPSPKKRKTIMKWTNLVKVNSESGLEGPNDDGHSWRKYGQKDILGAKYPRSYYRCTYRNNQNCWATKQVQRSDDDHTLFEVTYKGVHTCSHRGQIIADPDSLKKQNLPIGSAHLLFSLPSNIGEELVPHKSCAISPFTNNGFHQDCDFPDFISATTSFTDSDTLAEMIFSDATPQYNQTLRFDEYMCKF